MTAPEPAPPAGVPARAVNWQRNLLALWFAEFTAIFGFSFSVPFIPIFLKDLGITQPGDLALTTGYASGASGLAMAVLSPIWGVLADRYGRKSMLIRAMLGGAVSVGLMGFVEAPWQLIVLRLVQGATSGTVAAATAIVASATPRAKVGWALGLLSSAIAVGGAAGPVVGGVLASLLGVRHVFQIGGVLLILATIPVLIIVKEAPLERAAGQPAPPAMATLRAAGAGTVAAIAALLAAQALSQMTYSAFQPLIVLRLLNTAGNAATSLTGVTFGVAGIASALAALTYSRAVRQIGYRQVTIISALLLAAAELLVGLTSPVVLLVIGGAAAGFFYGALGPAVSSMIGLEVPVRIQARVFGVSSSATALGFGIGPLLGGQAAALSSVPVAIGVASAIAVLTAATGVLCREPAR